MEQQIHAWFTSFSSQDSCLLSQIKAQAEKTKMSVVSLASTQLDKVCSSALKYF